MKKIELQKQGIFVNAYDESAIILHNIFDYKLGEQDKIYKVGFPGGSLNKVLNTLEDKKISYVYYGVNRTVIKEKDFKRLNKFITEYEKAVRRQEIDIKANLIYTKIKKLKRTELDVFLDKVLECLK